MRRRLLVAIACVPAVADCAGVLGFDDVDFAERRPDAQGTGGGGIPVEPVGPGGGSGGGPSGSAGAANVPDGGAAPDSSGPPPGPDAGPPPTLDSAAPPCGTDPWPTYGHDARRTFATDACVKGPLAHLWTYTPKVKSVFHALATPDAVFVQFSGYPPPFYTSSAVDRVSPEGALVWTWDSGKDYTEGHWGSLSGNHVWVQDDGMFVLDAASGAKVAQNGYDDWWGPTAPTPDGGLFVANTLVGDGPGMYVARLGPSSAYVWKQNAFKQCGPSVTDVLGGFAVDGGILFYAPRYAIASGSKFPYASGLYAFDAAGGTQKWYVAVKPRSAPSAGGGKIFLAEEGAGIVARSQADGAVVWQKALDDVGVQAPVLAGGRVIVATDAAVVALDAAAGGVLWQTPVAGAQAGGVSGGAGNGCSGSFGAAGTVTTLAAALGSGTLVVTADDGVHVLDLANGADLWKGSFPDMTGTPRDPVLVGKRIYAVHKGTLVALAQP